MRVYDTLIIGASYASIGYAIERGNTIVIDEHQVCDTVFSLTLPTFTYSPYVPKTEEGERLFSHFTRVDLIKNGQQNTSAFECALCAYLIEKNLIPTLKCRVISVNLREDEIYEITVQTNAGLEPLYAKRVMRAGVGQGQKWLCVLYLTEAPESAKEALLRVFPDATIEPAFYENRYAIHIPINTSDINEAKAYVYQKWNGKVSGAKILYMAPRFSQREGANALTDYGYENPIRAFEDGILLARGWTV